MRSPDLTPLSSTNGDALLTALLIAAVVHVAILLGIHFKAPQPAKINKTIEITLSHAPLKKAPKQAKYLAADHQLGAGDDSQKPEPLKQSLPSPEMTPPPAPKVAPQPVAQTIKPVVQKVLTQPQAVTKIVTPVQPAPEPIEATTPEPVVEQPRLTPEALQQQIAQLGEQIRNTRQSAEQSKIKFVNAVSTHKYLAAQYEKDWKDKVERTGNLNYPQAARKSGTAQTLTMDVGINADGSIYSMRIVRSSGNPGLDEAAKRIVKMSAPFAELPAELLSEVNVLVITRVWKFSDETGMTAR